MKYKYCKDDYGGAITQHRYNWIKQNGAIPKGYQIHHRNWDRYDNRIENLALMSNLRHKRFHRSFFPTLNPNSNHIFKIGLTSKEYNNFLMGLPSKLRGLLKNQSRVIDIISEWDKLWKTQSAKAENVIIPERPH